MQRSPAGISSKRVLPLVGFIALFVPAYSLMSGDPHVVSNTLIVLGIAVAIAAGMVIYERHHLGKDVDAETVLEFVGPADLEREAGRYTGYYLKLHGARRIGINEDLFDLLRPLGTEVSDTNGERSALRSWISSYRIPNLTLTFLPHSQLIVEVRDDNGQVLYREPALHGIDLAL